MSSADVTHIAWLDLETTGLYPSTDHILEIGLVLTDMDLVVLGEWSRVVIPPTLDILKMHPTVREMHTANGLIDDVYAEQHGSATNVLGKTWTDIGWADGALDDWLRLTLPDARHEQLALGGSGVSHFDVRWIDYHMPILRNWLYRSTLDVGVIRRFIESVVQLPELVPAVNRELNHRALDDARNHLAEARHYRDVLAAQWYRDSVL